MELPICFGNRVLFLTISMSICKESFVLVRNLMLMKLCNNGIHPLLICNTVCPTPLSFPISRLPKVVWNLLRVNKLWLKSSTLISTNPTLLCCCGPYHLGRPLLGKLLSTLVLAPSLACLTVLFRQLGLYGRCKIKSNYANTPKLLHMTC